MTFETVEVLKRKPKTSKTPSGVQCPFCCGQIQQVIDTRATPNGWKRRRRQCQCGKRFTTLETVLPEESEGRSKLSVGINIITYAMTLIQAHEAEQFSRGVRGRTKASRRINGT